MAENASPGPEPQTSPAPEIDVDYATFGPISVFVLAIIAAVFDWGVGVAVALSSLYVGYGPTFVGAVAGALWGFVHGFVFGLLVAWLYNKCLISRLRRRG